MGLVKCPDCEHPVSDHERARIHECPVCFRPFNREEWKKLEKQEKRKETFRDVGRAGKTVK